MVHGCGNKFNYYSWWNGLVFIDMIRYSQHVKFCIMENPNILPNKMQCCIKKRQYFPNKFSLFQKFKGGLTLPNQWI